MEQMVWNLTHGHLPHVVGSEEDLGLVRREASTQVISNKVLLSSNIKYNRVEFEEDDQIQELSEEGGHGGIRGLLVGAGHADSHVINK
jgi:hypothetical protein